MCLSMLFGGQPEMPAQVQTAEAPQRYSASATEAGAARTADKQRALAAGGLAAARQTGPRGLEQIAPNTSVAELLGQTAAVQPVSV